MDSLRHDLGFAVRGLLRNPGLSLVIIASLALGIGPNTAIFTLVNTAFLDDLGVAEADRMVGLWGLSSEYPGFLPHSYPNFEDLRDNVRGFEGMAAVRMGGFALAGAGGRPERLFGAFVSPGYFDLLGVGSVRGRVFDASDADGRAVAVISHRLWQRRFGGDPDIVGRTIEIDRVAFEIVGIADAGFDGTYRITNVELWMPLTTFEQVSNLGPNMHAREWRIFDIVGRLAPGVSIAEATASLDAVNATLRQSYPEANEGAEVLLKPLNEGSLGVNDWDTMTRGGFWLMAVVGVLLLIACGNVASLLLAHATRRRREIATRLALGAGRWRIVRQLLTESLLLAALGGIAGLGLAWLTRNLLWSLRPNFLTDLTSLDPTIDVSVLLFTVGVALTSGVVFGLIPAGQTFSKRLMGDLYERDGDSRGGRWYSTRNLLVIGQIALSVVSLLAAGLLIRNFRAFLDADPGYDAEALVSTGFNLRALGYDPDRSRDFYQRALERLEALPGVESATLGTNRPLAPNGLYRELRAEGGDRSTSESGVAARQDVVSINYFDTLGIAIRRGRAFDRSDRQDTRQVVIINETLARELWGEADPVGRRLTVENMPGGPLEVVGMAADATYFRLNEGPTPYFYRPREQVFVPVAVVYARVVRDPMAALQEVERTLQSLDPDLVLAHGMWVKRRLLGTFWPQRMGAVLVSLFAGLALLLSATGIYGCMAYSVAARRREIGIRMAMGADRASVRALILRQAGLLVGFGLSLGAVLAFFAVRVLESMLYQADARSFGPFAAVVLVLATVGTLAVLVPMRRATQVTPGSVLRAE